mgnify:CR=1 FL=1
MPPDNAPMGRSTFGLIVYLWSVKQTQPSVIDILSRMKYFLTILCSVFFTLTAFAQPSNNDCVDLIDLGTAPVCTGDIYTNVDATSSSTAPGDAPTCFNGGVISNDVFFGFTVDAALVDVTITISGTDQGPNGIPLENPQFALYRGDCGGLAELSCVIGSIGDNTISLDAVGLTPGISYFLQVDSYSESGTPVWGDFTVCIEEFIPAFNMGEETFTSSCSGSIFDSGGPDGDYGPAEDFTFTICPNDFTQCIALDIASFNIFNGDQLNVYEGASTASLLIASISGNDNGNEFIVESSDGCITLEFISDGFNNSAGFEASWQCSPLACDGSDFDNATDIGSIPFNDPNQTTCGEGANLNVTPCGTVPFLGGPETVFLYQSPGGLCASVNVTNALPGTGVLVLNGLPGDPGTVCVAQSNSGNIMSADFQEAGDYYIIVANPEGCTDFGLNIVEADCALSPALVDALCNPLNGCIQNGDITTEFMFEDGFQDVPNTIGVNNGCWFGVGAEPDYYWFTIEAQADGPFGFILSSANIPSDIDFNVWGPFTSEEVCETPQLVIDAVTNTQPIRSSYAGGTEPTGLADVHPTLGYPIEDVYDCDGINDDIVQTIPAQEGEVYVVLANDWGNQIQGGGILVDWGPSDPDVLEPLGATVAASDTSVCAGASVQLEVITGLDNIEWIGDNAAELSCSNCFDPVATPAETTVYMALLDAVCYVDTLEVTVNVFDLDAGPDVEVCFGETFEIPGGQDFDQATYEWNPPAELEFSCTDCATPEVTANIPGVYEVSVTLTADACSFMDMVTITVLNFTAPDFTVAEDDRICEGEEISIGGDPVDGNTYVWTSVPSSTIDQEANPTVQPDVTTTYFVSVTNGICPTPSVDSVTVEVTPLPIIEILETPDPLCQGDAIVLSNSTVEEDVNYSWNGPAEIVNPDSNITTIIPVISGNYSLVGERLGCEVSDVVAIDVIPILLDLNQPDTTFICQGESVQVTPQIIPSTAQLEWTPSDIMTNTPLLEPDTYTVYTATVTVGNCVRSDTFAIQVDSLPVDMTIVADPMEDPYCLGELATLTSPIYDPVNFPNITHEWIGLGLETSDTLYNMVITTVDTFTYQRTTINGGCIQVDTILLNVVTNEAVTISPSQPEICPGEQVQLSVASAGMLGEITWTPETGLSCTDCPNPVATPQTTTTYTVRSSIEGCAIEQSVTILVLDTPNVNLGSDQLLCEAQLPIELNPNGSAEPGTTYSWTADNDPDFASTEVNPTVNPTVLSTVYTLTATNVCGSDSDDIAISVIEPGLLIGVNNDVDTIVTCRGFEFDLTAQIVESSNGVNAFGWTYSGSEMEGTDVSYTAVESGLAVFGYGYGVADDVFCEVLGGAVFIQVNDAPQDVQLIDDQTVCFNDIPTFILNEGTGEPGVTYSWTGSDGFSSMEPDPEVTPTATTTYVLEAALGECSITDSVTITVTQPGTLTGGESQLITDDSPSATLTATVEGGGNPADIQWTFDSAPIGNGTPFTWTPTDSQFDELPGFAVATLDTGCEILVDSVLVQKLAYRIPDIFSPNGDGQNDVFRPFYLGEMDIVEVTVYNRWGQVVFESTDSSNPGWDGKKDGDKDAPSDVYIYNIRVGLGGITREETGQITLLR